MIMDDESELNVFKRFYVETMDEFNKIEKPIFSLNYCGANKLIETIFSASEKLIAHLNEINNRETQSEIDNDNE